MKRRLFIGSSSEGLNIAQSLKKSLDEACNSWIESTIWNSGTIFKLNRGTLDSLVSASRKYDYAILVATADDITIKREEIVEAIRDNVLFEAGLFTGALGIERAFILIDENINPPTDLLGITKCVFNGSNLDVKINEIIKTINETKHTFNYKPMPSAALAVGYFENFIKPAFKKLSKIGGKLTIYIPSAIHNLDDVISEFSKKHGRKRLSIINRRPILHKCKSVPKAYWDIPTTLQIIHSLISNLTIADVTGNSVEKDEWISYEIQNFSDTLEEMIRRNNYNKNIFIEDFSSDNYA